MRKQRRRAVLPSPMDCQRFPAGLCVGQAVPIHPVVSQLISKVVPGYPCHTAAVSLPAFLDAPAGKLGWHPGEEFAFAPARRGPLI